MEAVNLEVSVVHNDTVVMFLNLDRRLYLSIPILKLASMQEEQVALLISHELAHFLLDHQVLRLAKAFFVNRVFNKYFRK